MVKENPFEQNLAAVRQAIDEAAVRICREAANIRIVAVTKTVGPDAIAPLLSAGCRDFGENRWQQARDKVGLPEASEAIWHFIGRLQVNKVKYVVRHFHWIHSIDSLELAQAVSRRAESLGKTINCLIQVNTSGEESKAGVSPAQVENLLKAVRTLPGIAVCGLMTMAPHFENPEDTRPTFVRLRKSLEEARNRLSWPELRELSMGMSNDFPIAVEEGATMVRIGQRLMRGWPTTIEE